MSKFIGVFARRTAAYYSVREDSRTKTTTKLTIKTKPSQNLKQQLYILIIILVITPLLTKADNQKLPIPRFASIKANEVNARVGPSIKTPIEWVFVKKGEPVEIIAEYEQWRQIRDIKGEGGWVHSSVLSGKRSVIVISPNLVALTRNKIVARVSNYVRCLLNKCKQDYCQVCCKNYTGWLPKTVLWGVYKDE